MKYNRNFGKLVNGAIVYAPMVLNDEHGLNTRPSAEDYARVGYKPVVDERPATDSSHYAVATGWRVEDGGGAAPTAQIVRVYEIREIEKPPRTFSKLRAIGALKAAGVWAQVKAWIEANDLYDEYLAAQDFKEDNEYFVRGLGALKTQLGWSDEQAEEILAQCVAQ